MIPISQRCNKADANYISFTNCPLNGSVEDASVVRHIGVPKILHDERAVSKDIDHVSNVDTSDLVHLLSFLVRVGRTENTTNLFQNAYLYPAILQIKCC